MIPAGLLTSLGHDVVMYGLRLAAVVLALFLGWQAAKYLQRALLRGLAHAEIDQTISRFVANLGRVALLTLIALGALGALGVETSSFSAAIAGASVAIGLSFRDTLSNVAAGFMLLVFRPFRVGDVVNVAGATGTVFEIDLFLTKIDTADGRRVVMPNGTVFRSNIENHTHLPDRRVDATLIVVSTDVERVKLLLEAAMRPLAHASPPPIARLTRIAANTEWSLQFWCTDAAADETRHQVLAAVVAALSDAGVALA
jgi:small conductance mechanosensitive channel